MNNYNSPKSFRDTGYGMSEQVNQNTYHTAKKKGRGSSDDIFDQNKNQFGQVRPSGKCSKKFISIYLLIFHF